MKKNDGMLVEIEEMPPHDGRAAKGWCGGKQLISEAKFGRVYRYTMPTKIDYDKVRFGLYEAARHLRARVEVRRRGRDVFFRCNKA